MKQSYRERKSKILNMVQVCIVAMLFVFPFRVQAASSNNLLASVSFNVGDLNYEFSPSRTYYNLTLPKDTKAVDVMAKTQDASASYSVAGHTNIKSDASTGKIVITVVAASGAKKWYTFALQFSANGTKPPVTTTPKTTIKHDLQSIQFDIGELDVPFSFDVTSYTLTVPKDTKEVAVTAVATGSEKAIVEGNKQLGPEKENVIKVTFQGMVYEFRVQYESAVPVTTNTTNSKDFGLVSLEIKEHKLNKVFASDAYEYTMTVVDPDQKFEILAVATDPEAMIEVDQTESRLKIVVSNDTQRTSYLIRLKTGAESPSQGAISGVFQDLLLALVLLVLAIILFILSHKLKSHHKMNAEDHNQIL